MRVSWRGTQPVGRLELGSPGDPADADAAAARFKRLVILGGPGSGKTWLAKRTARRSAEQARQAIAMGEPLDTIEIPLYTTCSHLALYGRDDIRTAAASSAVNKMRDLRSVRATESIRTFFAERNKAVLLVLDGLDEARDPDARIRQADSLPWRIMLTSRPGSWDGQLVIGSNKDNGQTGEVNGQTGELEPLRYPVDVEPFVERWFAGEPERALEVIDQLRRRHDLQEAATVPLILRFSLVLAKNPAVNRASPPLPRTPGHRCITPARSSTPTPVS